MTVALREVDRADRADRAAHGLGTGQPVDVLVIDGDPSTRGPVVAALASEGFAVAEAVDGADGLRLLDERRPALVLLDLMLPDQSGLAVFRQIGARCSVPVITVTDADDEIDAVLSLEAGAADHVTKPFGVRELSARVRAVLRRAGHPSHPQPYRSPAGPISAGPLVLDPLRRLVEVDGRQLDLARKEFDLLELLVAEHDRVVTRARCLELLWPERSRGDSRTLDTHIKRLRKKIEVDPAHPVHLLTVRGVGYGFSP